MVDGDGLALGPGRVIPGRTRADRVSCRSHRAVRCSAGICDRTEGCRAADRDRSAVERAGRRSWDTAIRRVPDRRSRRRRADGHALRRTVQSARWAKCRISDTGIHIPVDGKYVSDGIVFVNRGITGLILDGR